LSATCAFSNQPKRQQRINFSPIAKTTTQIAKSIPPSRRIKGLHEIIAPHTSRLSSITQTMPGIFSSCITSTRPGLSTRGPFGFGEKRRTRAVSCLRSNQHSSGTSRTESSYGSVSDSEMASTSLHSKVVGSRGSDVISTNISTVTAATSVSVIIPVSQGFYSNKKNNAMIFPNISNGDQSTGDYQKRRKRPQYQPPRSPSPCEWGYFVDTAS